MTESRVLIVGAGSAGRMTLAELRRHTEGNYRPVGFIDDDPAKQGTEIDGLPVLGGRDAIPEALRTTKAQELLIALPSAHGSVIRDIVEMCKSARVRFTIVPGIWEIIRGDVHFEQIRRVEPEDLLGRQTVEADPALLAPVYRGKRVLVTGAGGSIGRELAQQVLALDPSALYLLGRGENSLFESEVVLRKLGSKVPVHLVLVDIRNNEAVRRAFADIKPQVVLHAAAHKHVTFMERYPEEAALNNVVATRNLVRIARETGVERLVMLSTDKAVNPRSVMGASKRLAELVLQEENTPETRLMAVRFGNVLGSRGSVVPLFRTQIQRGGPVTVSHAEVARYFMTVSEAAMLVLAAGATGNGGEVFILDMGEQLSILELARSMIVLSGFRPEEDIPIVITGLQPGEKLREELVHAFEQLEPTAVAKISTARRVDGNSAVMTDAVDQLEALALAGDRKGVVALLAALLPEAALGGAAAARGA